LDQNNSHAIAAQPKTIKVFSAQLLRRPHQD
jgi:hypothetical protein